MLEKENQVTTFWFQLVAQRSRRVPACGFLLSTFRLPWVGLVPSSQGSQTEAEIKGGKHSKDIVAMIQSEINPFIHLVKKLGTGLTKGVVRVLIVRDLGSS